MFYEFIFFYCFATSGFDEGKEENILWNLLFREVYRILFLCDIGIEEMLKVKGYDIFFHDYSSSLPKCIHIFKNLAHNNLADK